MSKTISCKDAGKDCDWTATAGTEEELMSLVTEHVLAEHKEIELNQAQVSWECSMMSTTHLVQL
jgi:predicted small metal-binding protein